MDFQEFWNRFRQRAINLHPVSKRHGLLKDWEGIEPVHVFISEPATETEVFAVEKLIGEQFPPQLRQLFLEGAKSCLISWRWPGQFRYAEAGYIEGIDFINKPDLEGFQSGGYCKWDLDAMPDLYAGWSEWTAYVSKEDTFLTEAEWDDFMAMAKQTASLEDIAKTLGSFDDHIQQLAKDRDGEDAVFYKMHAHFFARSFPFDTAPNGDYIAIDRGERGHMVMLNHEGCDEPGWFLGHDLWQWLDIISAMGFIAFDFTTISDLSSAAQANAYVPDQAIPDWYDKDCLPSAHILDANHKKADEWKAFFWGADRV